MHPGGSLQWRNGDVSGKCGNQGTASPINNPQLTTVNQRVHVYR